MKKPKILSIASFEYPYGRIDKFEIKNEKDIQGPIISFFKEIEFRKNILEKMDMEYPSTEGYFFFYDKGIKAHILVEEKTIFLIIDSNKEKEKIMNDLEKFFSIF
ncbi:MAG: hypothetical protein ACP5OG_03640 [Candidatus Nanoarchaeia archaeon]